MNNLAVSRIVGAKLIPVGTILRNGRQPSFKYDPDYLERKDAMALSMSLPLRATAFDASSVRPYFEGLLPEGATRAVLAARAMVPEDDYLSLLELGGLDCVGDVVVRGSNLEESVWDEGSYEPLPFENLSQVFTDYDSLADSNIESRLSLAGTQGKVGLAHDPRYPITDGWLLPRGGAGSTHILKVTNNSRIGELETLCMKAAQGCGIRAARTDAIFVGQPVVVSERYDRNVTVDATGLHVTRLHQEDLAQAFGFSSASKYIELVGGTFASIAQVLYERSSSTMEDIEQLARIATYDYLVGNCDNHLKNIALLYQGDSITLAPIYDVTSTTYFEGFDRHMGRRLGNASLIDEVSPGDFFVLAKEIGIGRKRMKRICAEICESIIPALTEAGDMLEQAIVGISYLAEDLIEDLTPRLEIAKKAALD